MNRICSVWRKLQALVWRSGGKGGLLKLAFTYFLLIGFGFIYLYPIIYMVVSSLFSLNDLTDPAVRWIPRALYFDNFREAFITLDFLKSLGFSILTSLVPALLQTVATAVIGFGLARFPVPLKKLWLVLIVATFLIPYQVTTLPRYLMFDSYHMLESVWPTFLPALFGQGYRSAIFLLVFFSFFSSYPKSMDEAASIDGAGRLQIFYRIALPAAKSAIVMSFLFSFVWYWNEVSQSALYFGQSITTLPIQLQNFTSRYVQLAEAGDGTFMRLNESISMAGILLSILPLIIMYCFLQKQFVESIERSGITGE